MTPEQSHNLWIRGLFTDHDEDYLRIENTTENGTPDINICKGGMEIWIESKVCYRDRIVIRKEQFAWGVRRSHTGGSVFVLALDEPMGMIYIHQFPSILIKPRGDNKTLWIMSAPLFSASKGAPDTRRMVKKFLYPAL